MKHYRVVYGYGKDDFISIEESELQRALLAQGKGGVFVTGEGTIAGNEIKRIVPDYQRDMGWNRDYQLTGEDYAEIGDAKMRAYIQFQNQTLNALQGNQRKMLDGS